MVQQAPPPSPQRPLMRYTQYGGGTVGAVQPGNDDARRSIALAAIAIGVLGLIYGLFATPQGRVSPELIGSLGPSESKLVTVICPQCEPAAAKAIVGEENYFGSPARDRLVVRATGAQISQMENLDWVKYVAR